MLGAQSSVIDSKDNGFGKHGFIFNSVLAQDKAGRNFNLQYQMEKNSFNGHALQINGEVPLPLNRRTTVQGKDALSKGLRINFFLEGAAPSKRAASKGGDKAPKDEYGTVQLIH